MDPDRDDVSSTNFTIDIFLNGHWFNDRQTIVTCLDDGVLEQFIGLNDHNP